jgi:hypothetical protein
MSKSISEGLKLRSMWIVRKWKDPEDKISAFLQKGGKVEDAEMRYGEPFQIVTSKGNLALNEGITALLNLLVGSNPAETSFSGGNAYLGVGDSGATAAASQTGLLAAVNKLYKAVDAGYPTISAQTVTWQATFASADANFAWKEETVASGNSDAADNLNRATTDKGTKVSGETWALQLQITPS